MNDIPKTVPVNLRNALYNNLAIEINGKEMFAVQLQSYGSHAIERFCRPNSAKDRICVPAFFQDEFVQCFDDKYYFVWRLKDEYQQERVKNTGTNANDWDQCWAVHGLQEDKGGQLNCHQFVAVYKNKLFSDPSKYFAEKRIAIHVYCKDNADVNLKINGKEFECISAKRSVPMLEMKESMDELKMAEGNVPVLKNDMHAQCGVAEFAASLKKGLLDENVKLKEKLAKSEAYNASLKSEKEELDRQLNCSLSWSGRDIVAVSSMENKHNYNVKLE